MRNRDWPSFALAAMMLAAFFVACVILVVAAG